LCPPLAVSNMPAFYGVCSAFGFFCSGNVGVGVERKPPAERMEMDARVANAKSERKPPPERMEMDARVANAKRMIAPCTATIYGVKEWLSECFIGPPGVKGKLEQCVVVEPEKENDMDWDAIFFAIALPVFIFGVIGLGVYVHRLPT
jgi:hypothetical protein